MAGAPRYFVESLRRLKAPFDIDNVAAIHPDLSRDSVRVYLSLANEEGLLERVGMGSYVLPASPSPSEISEYPSVELLRANLLPDAWRQLVVWSSDDLAAFRNDISMQRFVVVESPRKTIATIHMTLERSGTLVIQLKSRRELSDALRNHTSSRVDDDGATILLPNEGLLGTQISGYGYRVPRPERLFLDLLDDDHYALDLLADASPRLGLDPMKLLRYAGPRKKTAEIASMLTTLIALHPDHPMRPGLEKRWFWLRGLP